MTEAIDPLLEARSQPAPDEPRLDRAGRPPCAKVRRPVAGGATRLPSRSPSSDPERSPERADDPLDRRRCPTMAILRSRLWRHRRRQQGRHQDRLGRLLRVEAHGRDVRPGPRERGLQGDPQSRPWLAPRARSRPSSRARSTWCPSTSAPASATTTSPTRRSDHAHGRRRGQQGGAAGRPRHQGPDGGKLATVLAITPGQDQNAAVVRPDTATSLKLTKMSDLAAVQDQLKWGLPPDCDNNPLCKGALEEYGITYPPKQREALGRLRRPDRRGTQGQGRRLRLALLHPAGHPRQRLHDARG